MTGFTIFMIVVSVALVFVILLQQKGTGLGSMAGQESGEEIAQTRRGAERVLHIFTILLALTFAAGAIYKMLV